MSSINASKERKRGWRKSVNCGMAWLIKWEIQSRNKPKRSCSMLWHIMKIFSIHHIPSALICNDLMKWGKIPCWCKAKHMHLIIKTNFLIYNLQVMPKVRSWVTWQMDEQRIFRNYKCRKHYGKTKPKTNKWRLTTNLSHLFLPTENSTSASRTINLLEPGKSSLKNQWYE